MQLKLSTGDYSMSSTSDKVSGKTKQAVGKLTHNQTLQAKGKAEEARGVIKKSIIDAGKKLSE
jgi:uncharacterized protein YjbJ (UPF0337 family)